MAGLACGPYAATIQLACCRTGTVRGSDKKFVMVAHWHVGLDRKFVREDTLSGFASHKSLAAWSRMD